MDCVCIHVFIFSEVVPKRRDTNLVIVSSAWRQTLYHYMSHVMRKKLFLPYANKKGADSSFKLIFVAEQTVFETYLVATFQKQVFS